MSALAAASFKSSADRSFYRCMMSWVSRSSRLAFVTLPFVASAAGCAASDATEREDVSSQAEALTDPTLWAQDGYTAAKARVNSAEVVLGTGTVAGLASAWTATTSSTNAAPVRAGSTVFVASLNGTVNAYNASTGALLWSTPLGSGVNASPAVAAGRVFVTTKNRRLHALNATTGAVIFQVLHPGSVSYSAPLVVGSRVFVRSDTDGTIYGYDIRGTGALLATVSAGDGGASADPSSAYGLLYVPSWDGKVYAFSATCTGTCAPSWSTATLGPMYFSPAVASNRIYVTVFGDAALTVRSLDAASGAGVWSKTLTGATSATGTAVASGRVLVGVEGPNELWALSTSSGALVWRGALSAAPTDSPAVANGVAYAPSGRDTGHLEAFGLTCATSGASCTPLWSASLPGYVGSPVVAGGAVLVSAQKKTFAYALP